MNIKAGEAFVGINRRGSQLEEWLADWTVRSRSAAGAYLRRQNMAAVVYPIARDVGS